MKMVKKVTFTVKINEQQRVCDGFLVPWKVQLYGY